MGRAGGCVIGPLCARGRGFSQESRVIRVFRCEPTLYLSGVRRGQGIAVLEREAERGRAGLPREGGPLRVRSRRWRGEGGGGGICQVCFSRVSRQSTEALVTGAQDQRLGLCVPEVLPLPGVCRQVFGCE